MSNPSPTLVTATRERLGPVGAWLSGLGSAPREAAVRISRAVEAAGFTSLWSGEALSGTDIFDVHRELLEATSGLILATGIANMWARPAPTAAERVRELHARFPSRIISGFGTSHRELTGTDAPRSPLGVARDYLGELQDRLGQDRPPIVLAALGPRMTTLAAELTDGAHSYLTTPHHTATMRTLLGPDRLLIVELPVALGPADAAREHARRHIAPYLRMENYARSFRRMGLDPSDPDAVISAVVATNDHDALIAAVDAHLRAGADHVCLQPLSGEPSDEAVAALADVVRAVRNRPR